MNSGCLGGLLSIQAFFFVACPKIKARDKVSLYNNRYRNKGKKIIATLFRLTRSSTRPNNSQLKAIFYRSIDVSEQRILKNKK